MLVLACDPAGEDLAFPAARAEAARHEHAVDPARAPRAPRRCVMFSASTQRTWTSAAVLRCPRASAPRAPTGRRRGASRTCRRARSRPTPAALSMRSVSSSHSAEVGPGMRRGRACGRRDRRGPARGARAARGRRRETSGFVITASTSTSAKSAIFSRISRCSGSVERQTSTSGWIPMRRSSLTECCVGFVFSSPAVSMYGTSVTCR